MTSHLSSALQEGQRPGSTKPSPSGLGKRHHNRRKRATGPAQFLPGSSCLSRTFSAQSVLVFQNPALAGWAEISRTFGPGRGLNLHKRLHREKE